MSAAAARLAIGLVAAVLIGWALGEACVSLFAGSDLDAVRDVTTQRTADLNTVMRTVTWAGSAFLLIPLAVVCCLALARLGQGREALAIALSLAGAIVISTTVKALLDRPRPPVQHLQAVGGASFPSGHATQSSAFYFSLLLMVLATRPRPLLSAAAIGGAVLLVLAVAASRVYLGVHYPSDVIAGMLLGASWAAFTRWCLRPAASVS